MKRTLIGIRDENRAYPHGKRQRTAWTVTDDGRFLLTRLFYGWEEGSSVGIEVKIRPDDLKYSNVEIEIDFNDHCYPFVVETEGGKTVETSKLVMKFSGGEVELPRLADSFRLFADVIDGQMSGDPTCLWSNERIAAENEYRAKTGQIAEIDIPNLEEE